MTCEGLLVVLHFELGVDDVFVLLRAAVGRGFGAGSRPAGGGACGGSAGAPVGLLAELAAGLLDDFECLLQPVAVVALGGVLEVVQGRLDLAAGAGRDLVAIVL